MNLLTRSTQTDQIKQRGRGAEEPGSIPPQPPCPPAPQPATLRPKYQRIAPAQVKPGDWHKFAPPGQRPQYHQIIAILPERNLIQIKKPDDSTPWVYLVADNVSYGREVSQ